MSFLGELEQYDFLSDALRSTIFDTYKADMLSEKQQHDILEKCRQTKTELIEWEKNILEAIVIRQQHLIFDSASLSQRILSEQERFDQRDDEEEIESLESLLS